MNTSVSKGQNGIVAHLQSIMRAASVRPEDLGVQWLETSRGSVWTLRLRWGDASFDMSFKTEDVAGWSESSALSEEYLEEIYRLIDWLVANP